MSCHQRPNDEPVKSGQSQDSMGKEGETQQRMQLLIAGRASVKSPDRSTIHQLEQGAIVEAASAVESQPATFSVVHESNCETLLVQRNELPRFDNEDEQLALRLYKYALSTTHGVSSFASNAV